MVTVKAELGRARSPEKVSTLESFPFGWTEAFASQIIRGPKIDYVAASSDCLAHFHTFFALCSTDLV